MSKPPAQTGAIRLHSYSLSVPQSCFKKRLQLRNAGFKQTRMFPDRTADVTWRAHLLMTVSFVLKKLLRLLSHLIHTFSIGNISARWLRHACPFDPYDALKSQRLLIYEANPPPPPSIPVKSPSHDHEVATLCWCKVANIETCCKHKALQNIQLPYCRNCFMAVRNHGV